MKSPRILKRWLGFPSRYSLLRKGVTFKESRAYNTTGRVLLTFDDYGARENIDGILALLKREHIKALFLLTGEWALKHRDIITKIEAQGHWVGSHSYHHMYLDRLSDEKVADEMKRGLQTKIMRPPYGAYDKRVRKIVHGLGFKIAYWTIDSFDWKGISAKEIIRNVVPNLHKGACILLHLNAPHTLEALPGIIAAIRERGLEICYDGTEINV